jgi:uncharacterized Zn finger protein
VTTPALNGLDEAGLLVRAGQANFARGSTLAAGGRVQDLTYEPTAVSGRVDGRTAQLARLVSVDGDFSCECTCGGASASRFCAHAVAVALAANASRRVPDTTQPSYSLRSTWDDLRSRLERLDKRDLLELLSAHAQSDERLMRRIHTAVLRTPTAEPDVEQLSAIIEDAARLRALDGRQSTMEFAMGLAECADTIESVLREGHATAALTLCDKAIDAVEESLKHASDDEGEVSDVLQRLQDLHLEACRVVRPEPRGLARRLWVTELQSTEDVFRNAVVTYREVLGDAGVDEYRALTKPLWDAVPERKPGDPHENGVNSYRLKAIMLALASISPSSDAWIGIESRDLSSPGSFIDIASRLARDRQLAAAIDWAQRGAVAFPARDGMRVRLLLAELLRQVGRCADATDVTWTNFVAEPGVATYEALNASARLHDAWPAWRERARQHFVELLQGGSDSRQHGGSARWDRSLGAEWVRIQMLEHDFEAAWKDGLQFKCPTGLLMELARAREVQHPADAIPVYQRLVAELIEARDKRAYAAAVAELRHMKTLAERAGQADQFAEYINSIRTQHRAKINLMASMDKVKLD